MKVNVNLFTWLQEKKGKKITNHTQIFFFFFGRFQTAACHLSNRLNTRELWGLSFCVPLDFELIFFFWNFEFGTWAASVRLSGVGGVIKQNQTPVASAWWRQRGSTWAGRFSRSPTSVRGGGVCLSLSLYISSLGKEGTDITETPMPSCGCRRWTSAGERFAEADLLKFDRNLQRLTGACWVKCGRLLVVRYCCVLLLSSVQWPDRGTATVTSV